jgi:hypothetical protein
MTAFKRFDTAAFYQYSGISPAAPAASAANKRSAPNFAAVAASAAGCTSELDVQDFQDFYEERAAVLEYDGELDRLEAERQAFDAVITLWMNLSPPPLLDDDHCAQCGNPVDGSGQDGVPFLSGGGGHVWLHHGCHTAWMVRRRRQATEALNTMGIGL